MTPAAGNYTPQDAADALGYIDPGCDRPEWVKVAMAAKAAGVDFDAFDAWSEAAPNYTQAGARDTWRSVAGDGGIKAGTLFHMARAGGWPGTAARTSTPTSIRKPPARAAAPAKSPRPGIGASEVWKRCEAATNEHPYVAQKHAAGVPLDGLRVLPADDTLRIAGESMAGALVVPARRADGSISSLQFVALPEVAARLKAAGKPGKLNLPGMSVEGWHTVGELRPGGVVHICEGIGQAWACWQATGHAAVVALGWGRVRAVAAELRARDSAAHLVLVPDAGKEHDAEKIAAEVGAAVACMPKGEVNNFDACDLGQRDGFDALGALLESANKASLPTHPLALFVEFDESPKAPRWVIPGFIGHGVVIVAGAHGVGKTTALLPLAMVAAGLHVSGDPLAPREWRHVVYIVEDIEQAQRILAGITSNRGPGLDVDAVRQRLHLVEARRLEPTYAVEVGKDYREQFTRTVDGVEVLPLVVVDTKAAVLAMEDENSNSESSKVMAAFKQGFEGLPTWLVGHVAKANMTRADAGGLSMRGGSAFEADANQVLYLVKETDDTRYLVRGKTRFEAQWPELVITSDWVTTTAPDEFGNLEAVTLRWGIASPPEQSRKEAQEQAQEQASKADATALRDDIRNAVEAAYQSGFPLNREGVKAKVKRDRNKVSDCIENLLSEQWLHEVAIAAKERTNPKRAAFLVNLSTEEHDAVRRGEGLPQNKLAVPESWKKPAIPSVLADLPHEVVEDAHAHQ